MTKKPKFHLSADLRPVFGREGELGLLSEVMRPSGRV
jgi:hypothetical protein